MNDFTFTRSPSLNIEVSTEIKGAAVADNTIVIIGHMAASGSSVTANIPVLLENYGDEALIQTECDTKFGAGSEIGEMALAAVKANKYSNMSTKVYPPIQVLPMANGDTDLEAALLANQTMPMPFVAPYFDLAETALHDTLRDHLNAISASDRGKQGQFGSFGFVPTDDVLGTVSPLGIASATEKMVLPWLRDSEVLKANKTYEVAAAVAAVIAANPVPFNPVNEIVIGGLNVPAKASDHHTPSAAGSVALGLSAGLTPLEVNFKGEVVFSRAITSLRNDAAVEDYAYFDVMDWQVMYFYRKNAYSIARQDRYVRAKNSAATLKNLKSELIVLAKDFESQGMFQHVEKFLDQFTVERPTNNRSAAIFRTPFNVVAGLHNIAIDAIGTDQFDEFEL